MVRVHGYLTDIADIDATGDVFCETFGRFGVRPYLVQVAVAALDQPDARVELEAEAFVGILPVDDLADGDAGRAGGA